MSHSLRTLHLVVGCALVVACSSSSAGDHGSKPTPDAASDAAAGTPAAFSGPGTYAVATLDEQFVDPSRATPANGTYGGASARTLDSTVWYPTTGSAGAVANGGPFPIIQYAHGFGGDKTEVDWLMRHLASHGYIVVAPTFPLSSGTAPGGRTFDDLANQPGDLAFVVEQVKGLTGAHADLGAAVDVSKQGVAGWSLGGATTLIAVYHPTLHLPNVRVAVALAPASDFFGPAMYVRALPTLILSGGSDEIIQFANLTAGPQTEAPAPLMVANLVGGTHGNFGENPPTLVAGANGDDVGCSYFKALLGSTVDVRTYPDLVTELTAGADGGVVAAAPFPICPTPDVQTMTGDRQHELTKAAALAQFESILRGSQDAANYLTSAFDADNDDVEVTRAR